MARVEKVVPRALDSMHSSVGQLVSRSRFHGRRRLVATTECAPTPMNSAIDEDLTIDGQPAMIEAS